MKVLVFGAGAVGSYLGGRLSQAGNEVTLILRQTAASLIASDGLFITEEKKRSLVHPHTVTSLRQALMREQFDVMLTCMKAYDVETAINEMVAFMPDPPPIITMQNGIGIEERFAAEFGPERIIAGTVTIPLSLSASNSVLVEKSGDRGVGLAPMVRKQNIKDWVRMFKQSGINVTAVRDAGSLKWSKALLNIIGNATSAILNRHPSAIYKYAPTFNLEMDMLEEGLAVAKASGIKIVDLPGPKLSQLTKSMRWMPRSMIQPILSRLVASGRGDKMPSFQVDLSSGKGKNEVVFHNLAIAKQGEAVGVPTPVNEALGTILQRITNKDLDWQRYNGKPDQLVADVNRFRQRSRA